MDAPTKIKDASDLLVAHGREAVRQARGRARPVHLAASQTPTTTVHEPPEQGEFPLDALNATQRRIVESAAEVYQIKPELPAMASVAVLGGAIGKSHVVHGAVSGRETYCNIYVLAGAPKSYGKNACTVIANPLTAASTELSEAFKLNERPALIQERRVIEKQIVNRVNVLAKVRSGKAEPLSESDTERLNDELVKLQKRLDFIEPLVRHLPSYWIGSSTSAAFAEFLARNDGTLFSYSPEAGELVRIALGRFSKDKAGDFDLLLSGYTVEVFRETRVGRGDHELTPCVGVLWFCQPFLLRELFANEEALERGLTARVLPFIVEHDVIPYDDGIVRTVDEQARDDWNILIRLALSVRDKRYTIQCSDEAREVFRVFHNEAVDLRNGHYRDVEGELGRWRENAVRIAGGQCVADALEIGEVSDSLVLTEEHAIRGVRITRWAHLSGLHLLEKSRRQRQLARVQTLARLVNQYQGRVTLRDLRRKHGFNQEEVRRLAAASPSLLAIRVVKADPLKAGRPSEYLTIPKIN